MKNIGKNNPSLRLLPSAALVKTGEVDHADWNYRPILGRIQRLRFEMVRRLLGTGRYGRLLEIGYGSGVFMPELATHCDELFGIDPHPRPEAIAQTLALQGVKAQLVSGSATALPFDDGMFQAIVVVSALEFIDDLEAACDQMIRVLSPGGIVVVVTPGRSPLVDLGLRVLTGKRPQSDFGDRREKILPVLFNKFQVQRRVTAPPLIGRVLPLYTALRLCVAAGGGK